MRELTIRSKYLAGRTILACACELNSAFDAICPIKLGTFMDVIRVGNSLKFYAPVDLTRLGNLYIQRSTASQVVFSYAG